MVDNQIKVVDAGVLCAFHFSHGEGHESEGSKRHFWKNQGWDGSAWKGVHKFLQFVVVHVFSLHGHDEQWRWYWRYLVAGKGNSTYCLQTWTHMSENAQNIAFFTRFVGTESAGLSLIIYINITLYIYICINIIIYINYIDL